jgi:hypothetical protein
MTVDLEQKSGDLQLQVPTVLRGLSKKTLTLSKDLGDCFKDEREWQVPSGHLRPVRSSNGLTLDPSW